MHVEASQTGTRCLYHESGDVDTVARDVVCREHTLDAFDHITQGRPLGTPEIRRPGAERGRGCRRARLVPTGDGDGTVYQGHDANPRLEIDTQSLPVNSQTRQAPLSDRNRDPFGGGSQRQVHGRSFEAQAGRNVGRGGHVTVAGWLAENQPCGDEIDVAIAVPILEHGADLENQFQTAELVLRALVDPRLPR